VSIQKGNFAISKDDKAPGQPTGNKFKYIAQQVSPKLAILNKLMDQD